MDTLSQGEVDDYYKKLDAGPVEDLSDEDLEVFIDLAEKTSHLTEAERQAFIFNLIAEKSSRNGGLADGVLLAPTPPSVDTTSANEASEETEEESLENLAEEEAAI